MSTDIREKVLSDMKEAMKARDQVRLDTIRFLQAAIKKQEIDMRPNPMTAEEAMTILKRMVKQRKESIEQFQAAARQDLVDKETTELKILETYLPTQMGREQVEKIVQDVITGLKATSAKDMGNVMKAVQARIAGQADNKVVSEVVRAKLQS